jgi:hypothetical protein
MHTQVTPVGQLGRLGPQKARSARREAPAGAKPLSPPIWNEIFLNLVRVFQQLLCAGSGPCSLTAKALC